MSEIRRIDVDRRTLLKLGAGAGAGASLVAR